MRPETPARLWDALDAARRASEIIAGLTTQSYLADWIRQAAAERQLEIIGEALNRIRRDDPVTADRIPDVHAVIATRNIIVHRYDGIDHVRVWATVHDDMPVLVAALAALLEEIDDPGW